MKKIKYLISFALLLSVIGCSSVTVKSDFDPEYDFGKFTINEWKIITLIDGKRSINEITTVAKLDRLEVCKTLSSLLEANIIRLIDKQPKKPDILSAIYVKPKTGIMRKILDKIRSI